MTWEQLHPAINAALNLTAFCLLVAGRISISKGRREEHRRRMVGAFMASTIFLISYVIRFLTTGAHKYPGDGWDKIVYLVTLFSHMVLAVALVPLVLMALKRGLKADFPAHKKIVKFTWPVWIYVSATGVLVYLMLYHLGPALHS